MKTKITLYFISILIPTLLCSQIASGKFSYPDYLEQKNKMQQVYDFIRTKNYNDALNLVENLKCRKFLCKEKYELLSLLYFYKNENKNAESYLLQSVENGLDPKDVYFVFVNFKEQISKIDEAKIDSAYKKYKSEINIDLRKRIQNNYYNRTLNNSFDSILAHYIWVGYDLLGHDNTCNPELPSKMHYIFLTEIDDERFEKYYLLFLKECENYNESWREFEFVLRTRLERKLNQSNNILPLKHICLNSNNEIDVEKSLLEIHTIANIVKKVKINDDTFFSMRCDEDPIQYEYNPIKILGSSKLSSQEWQENIKILTSEFSKLGIDEKYIQYLQADEIASHAIFGMQLIY
jgi:hypothetical protein